MSYLYILKKRRMQIELMKLFSIWIRKKERIHTKYTEEGKKSYYVVPHILRVENIRSDQLCTFLVSVYDTCCSILDISTQYRISMNMVYSYYVNVWGMLIPIFQQSSILILQQYVVLLKMKRNILAPAWVGDFLGVINELPTKIMLD